MYLFTELIRLLEQRGYAFPADPHAATDALRRSSGSDEDKLHRRAVIIDRDRMLATRLETHRQRLRWLLSAATLLWFGFGFVSAYALMEQGSLNFLLLLAGVLGVNTLMLLVWLAGLFLPRRAAPPFAALFSGSRDTVAQALLELYAQAAAQPYARWRRGAIAHRLALGGLVGMFAAMLLRLAVRQYRFSWESTLLDTQAFAALVGALAWLPETIGFAVPDAAAVQAARNVYQAGHAASWGSLLLGSLLCYGIAPRLAAWLWCLWQSRRTHLRLDTQLPYYQNIIRTWNQRITDTAADYRADEITPAAPVRLNTDGLHWAVLLDAPAAVPQWFAGVLGQDWVDKGVLAERGEFAVFAEQLAQQPVQLLVGVRADRVPDRGMVRQLAKLAQAAQEGMVVQFLFSGSLNGAEETAAQWRQLSAQYGWVWLE